MKFKLHAAIAVATSMSWALEPNGTSLEARAHTAMTATQHAKVAREFQLRAKVMDASAALYEAEAKALGPNRVGVVAKWPAMAVNSPYEKAIRHALEARRAANESRDLAVKHLHLAHDAAAAAKTTSSATAIDN